MTSSQVLMNTKVLKGRINMFEAKNFAKRLIKFPERIKSSRKFQKDLHDILALFSSSTEPRRVKNILFATSMANYDGANNIDAIMSLQLARMGHRVSVILCDKKLGACQLSKIGKIAPQEFVRSGNSSICDECYYQGKGKFRLQDVDLLRYGQFFSAADQKKIDEILVAIPVDQIRNFKLHDVAVGEHAYAGALRYYARGDLAGEDHGQEILKIFFKASLKTFMVFFNLFKARNIDVVVAHHGIYVPQGIIVGIAKIFDVRIVTHNPAYRKNTFIFAHNDSYHHTMLAEDSQRWLGIELTNARRRKIQDYLNSRRTGKDDWIWFAENSGKYPPRLQKMLRSEKTNYLCCTSVMWDAQLHYKANAFDSMADWIVETIRLFIEGEVAGNLIIRVHPAEISGAIPSRQKITDVINEHFEILPENIFLVDPDSAVSTYDLIDDSDVCIVYNTKTGIEMAANGAKVVVAGEAWIRGKGFTIDVTDKNLYPEILRQAPTNNKLSTEQHDIALKYAYYFFFRRMIKLPMISSPKKFNLVLDSQIKPTDLIAAKSSLDTISNGIVEGTFFEANDAEEIE